MTTRTGTPAQYEELARLANSIVAQSEQVRKLALDAGEVTNLDKQDRKEGC
jgi:hypothetical protein